MSKKIAIAIDGPAGSGKSTIAKKLADYFDYIYIDTGAMYRAITLKAIRLGIQPDDAFKLKRLTETTEIILNYQRSEAATNLKVIMDGEDVSDAIRSLEVTSRVSEVAAVAAVREAMVSLQRKMAESSSVVMDGRDIGTVVLPQAQLKIYLTASVEERGRRRWLELKAKGTETDQSELTEQIGKRDFFDSHREVNPLRQASDAVLIDTTNLSIDEVVSQLIQLAKAKGAEPNF